MSPDQAQRTSDAQKSTPSSSCDLLDYVDDPKIKAQLEKLGLRSLQDDGGALQQYMAQCLHHRERTGICCCPECNMQRLEDVLQRAAWLSTAQRGLQAPIATSWQFDEAQQATENVGGVRDLAEGAAPEDCSTADEKNATRCAGQGLHLKATTAGIQHAGLAAVHVLRGRKHSHGQHSAAAGVGNLTTTAAEERGRPVVWELLRQEAVASQVQSTVKKAKRSKQAQQHSSDTVKLEQSNHRPSATEAARQPISPDASAAAAAAAAAYDNKPDNESIADIHHDASLQENYYSTKASRAASTAKHQPIIMSLDSSVAGASSDPMSLSRPQPAFHQILTAPAASAAASVEGHGVAQPAGAVAEGASELSPSKTAERGASAYCNATAHTDQHRTSSAKDLHAPWHAISRLAGQQLIAAELQAELLPADSSTEALQVNMVNNMPFRTMVHSFCS